MNQRIAGSELLYYDTAAHNICDGYATHCIEDLMTFLKKHPCAAPRVGNQVATVQAALNPNPLADPHVPRRSFGRGRLLASTKEIVIGPFKRNVEFRSGK
jgi:hypothetical protein